MPLPVNSLKRAVVVGAGPAGLMAADVLASGGVAVTVCDAMPSFGRKLLMAGKSGLNLTKAEPLEQMLPHFGVASGHLQNILENFDSDAVQAWAQGLGQDVFTGTTGRVFPREMKASPLLRAWLARLDDLGVERRTRLRWIGWRDGNPQFEGPAGREILEAEVVILALGGASWSRLGSDGRWQETLEADGISLAPFGPSNSAVSVEWSSHMRDHFGAPIKSVKWQAGDIVSRGEAILSAKGLEGGGMYHLTPALRKGTALFVDLVPDSSPETLERQLSNRPDKLRVSHWLKKVLRLPPAKVALFFEMTAGQKLERSDWVSKVKMLPVTYSGLRPMDEAISTCGGVRFDDLTSDLMLKTRPGTFCAGEMLDWEAPTGGYLITGCLATGRWAGHGAVRYLENAA